MTLAPDQRTVLLRYGGWPVADLLLDPQDAIPKAVASFSGGSFTWRSQPCWRQTTRKGIVLHRRRETEPLIVVPWTAITRFAEAMPAEHREVLAAARRAYQAETLRWHNLTTPKRLGGKHQPLTDEQWDEHLAIYREVSANLTAALGVVLGDPDTEPVQLDLFAGAS